jgi:hypothetical protein
VYICIPSLLRRIVKKLFLHFLEGRTVGFDVTDRMSQDQKTTTAARLNNTNNPIFWLHHCLK